MVACLHADNSSNETEMDELPAPRREEPRCDAGYSSESASPSPRSKTRVSASASGSTFARRIHSSSLGGALGAGGLFGFGLPVHPRNTFRFALGSSLFSLFVSAVLWPDVKALVFLSAIVRIIASCCSVRTLVTLHCAFAHYSRCVGGGVGVRNVLCRNGRHDTTRRDAAVSVNCCHVVAQLLFGRAAPLAFPLPFRVPVTVPRPHKLLSKACAMRHVACAPPFSWELCWVPADEKHISSHQKRTE